MAVHGSLLQNSDQFGGPWIPVSLFQNSDQSGGPWIPILKFGPMWRSKDPCILVLLLITTKEIPQTRIYDRHRFCGKSVVEIQKHSQKHNRFTTDLPQKIVYGCYHRHNSYGRFCGKSIIGICLWLILPTSGLKCLRNIFPCKNILWSISILSINYSCGPMVSWFYEFWPYWKWSTFGSLLYVSDINPTHWDQWYFAYLNTMRVEPGFTDKPAWDILGYYQDKQSGDKTSLIKYDFLHYLRL